MDSFKEIFKKFTNEVSLLNIELIDEEYIHVLQQATLDELKEALEKVKIMKECNDWLHKLQDDCYGR